MLSTGPCALAATHYVISRLRFEHAGCRDCLAWHAACEDILAAAGDRGSGGTRRRDGVRGGVLVLEVGLSTPTTPSAPPTVGTSGTPPDGGSLAIERLPPPGHEARAAASGWNRPLGDSLIMKATDPFQ
jgi:hypothetical protein